MLQWQHTYSASLNVSNLYPLYPLSNDIMILSGFSSACGKVIRGEHVAMAAYLQWLVDSVQPILTCSSVE